MKKLILCLFISAIAAINAAGQLNFYFIPEVYGRNIDGLGVFQVQNLSGREMDGSIAIQVRENNTQSMIVNILTPVTRIATGMNSFPKAVFSKSNFNFFPNAYSSMSNQTKTLPPGNYSFCFRFVPAKDLQDEYENCFDAEILPLVPMQLITPANLDSICEKRPVLAWQPPMPFHSTMRFRLLLVEKKNQSVTESILMDKPLVLVDNISSTQINYPGNYPELEEGKTYVWQVIAYQQAVIVSRSEVWEFTVKCSEDILSPPADSYSELKLLMTSNYYIANRVLRFTFRNDYNQQRLQYTIVEPAETGKIKRLPTVGLKPGLNKIDIDLSDMELENGKSYVLKVYPFNEPPVEIRFTYKED